MINREKTKAYFNYFPEDLPRYSTKPIYWTCDKCKKDYKFSKSYAQTKEDNSVKTCSDAICTKCARENRKGHSKKNEEVKVKALDLPPEVDFLRTLEELKVNVNLLSPWSREEVFLKCSCGKYVKTQRMNLNKNKSIRETGHYKCSSCWGKKNHLGKKLSEETKSKISSSKTLKKVSGDQWNGDGFNDYKNNVVPFKKK